MANTYVPTNLRIEDHVVGSLVLDWDVSSVMDKNAKARYNIWGSNDSGSTWELVQGGVIRSEGSVPDNWAWYAVSSIHPTLGESAKSDPLELASPGTFGTTHNHTAVGMDKDGRFHYLKVADDGGLILGEGISVSIDTTDLSTEAKQDVVISNLGTINTNMGTGFTDIGVILNNNHNAMLTELQSTKVAVAKEVKQDAILAELQGTRADMNTKLQGLNYTIESKQNTVISEIGTTRTNIVSAVSTVDDSVNALKASNDVLLGDINTGISDLEVSNSTNLTAVQSKLDALQAELESVNTNVQNNFKQLLGGEAELTGVGTAGSQIVLPWSVRSIINKVLVLQEGGAATDFTVEIYNKATGLTERNVVIRSKCSDGFSPTRLDFTHVVPYINLDGNDSVVVKVIPNAGTSNNFFVSIHGEKTH